MLRNKNLNQRMQEFIKYHRDGDGECNTVVLVDWANAHNLDHQQRYELAYYFAVTYCVESAIVIFRERYEVKKDVRKWIEDNKSTLIFQSDRKYIRMRDSFEKCLVSFYKDNSDAERFDAGITKGGKVILSKAIEKVEKWVLFGRFSAFLFLEMYINLTGAKFVNTTIDWLHGNTATSGLLNLFGMDEAANHFDKTGKLPKNLTQQKMDELLKMVIVNARKKAASDNVTELETSLCAYRKLYKASRYNGFYLDRMLEEIYAMQRNYPSISKELLEIRARHYDKKYLGEFGGWQGIRREMKKLYIEKGVIG